MPKRKRYVILDELGPVCPRCRMPTQVRVHDVLREKQLRQPFYYSRWYYCENDDCVTTLIMPDEFKVFPEPAGGDQERLDAVRNQLGVT